MSLVFSIELTCAHSRGMCKCRVSWLWQGTLIVALLLWSEMCPAHLKCSTHPALLCCSCPSVARRPCVSTLAAEQAIQAAHMLIITKYTRLPTQQALVAAVRRLLQISSYQSRLGYSIVPCEISTGSPKIVEVFATQEPTGKNTSGVALNSSGWLVDVPFNSMTRKNTFVPHSSDIAF